MNTLQLEITDRLAVVRLDRGRSNPINQLMIAELIVCIRDLETDDSVGGVVVTGKEGFFSSGIDLIEAYNYKDVQIKQFWVDFLKLQSALAGFKKPLVAAISGHSLAGGCIIALCCDYRVMAEGPYIIGLNEVPVGIIVPNSVFKLYSFWLGQSKAYQYLLEGKLLKVDEALRVGLINETANAENLMTAAETKARTFMNFDPATWSASKMNLRHELLAKLNSDQTETLDAMLKQWWSPPMREGLKQMVTKLTSKNTA